MQHCSMGMEQPGWQAQARSVSELERFVGAMQAVEQACAALLVTNPCHL